MKKSMRAVLRGSISFAAFAVSFPTVAQTVQPPQAPLADVVCPQQALPVLPPCTTPGTRTVTPAVITVTPVDATRSTISATQNVTYSGNLAISGGAVTFNPVFGPFQLDPAPFFDPAAAVIHVDSNYDGTLTFNANNGALPFLQDSLTNNPIGAFNNYTFNSNTINSISVNIPQSTVFDQTSGRSYLYSLSTPDPTAFINPNAVALDGRFQSDPSSSGAIVFGKLTGDATVVTASGPSVLTPAGSGPLDADGNPTGGWVSPYALQYNITSTITTQLDENGLITPTVSVTNGINLNGSSIINVADGVNPGDAVNRGQLDGAFRFVSIQPHSPFAPGALALGTDSIAIGVNANVSGQSGAFGAVAIGVNSSAADDHSIAIGASSSSSIGSISIGAQSNSLASSVSIGRLSNAFNSVSLGDTASSDLQGVAIGNASHSGVFGTAIGQSALVSAENSVALGRLSIADRPNTVSVGSTAGSGLLRQIVNVAAGTQATDAVNKAQLDAALAAGGGANPLVVVNSVGNATANGEASIAIGGNARAELNRSIAVGQSAISYTGGVAVGAQTEALGLNTVAIGLGASAGVNASPGTFTLFEGESAIGKDAGAYGIGSVAIGSGARVGPTGSNSVAIGSRTDTARSDVVAVGNRQIVGVLAGTQANDAVNMLQFSSVESAVRNAQDTANNAQSVANSANATVNIVTGLAVYAQDLAIAAGADAATAKTTANTALANAATAQTTANTALSRADQALAGIGTAATNATTALNVANNAQTVANSAQTTANTAIERTKFVEVNAPGAVAPVASGANAIAVGPNANAATDNAVAIGNGATANGGAAVSIGFGNTATGNGAVAIGDPNVATGTGAVAMGADNTATGDGAVAIGNLSVANGAGNVALGNGAQATAPNSVALGGASIANQANTVSVGAAGAERRIVNVAAGTAATDAVNKGQLDAEAIARVTAIAAEATARTAADTALQSNINTEVAARTAGDTALQTNINSEASTRAAADVTLQANINAEAATRAAADVQLGNSIQTESQVRAQQILQANQRIAVEETARAALGTALVNESNARLAADLALSNRVDAIGTRLDQISGRLNGLENKIASGTAVATAMGGATFLPDMKFNLSANVATYDGARAGAFQLGILITPHVAMNAGVATGFNKGGKTAGRVGVTVGW